MADQETERSDRNEQRRRRNARRVTTAPKTWVACEPCKGTGEIAGNECPTCYGLGKTTVD